MKPFYNPSKFKKAAVAYVAAPDQSDKVMALDLVLDLLPSVKDKVFAASLVDQGNAKALSPKQMYWVETLTARALGKAKAAVEVEKVDVGSMEGLVSLFNKAKAKLKFPKLYLAVDSVPVVVSMAGEKSKAPGTINVAGEGDFESRAWYGRVDISGTWTKGKKVYAEQSSVESLLKALSRNPAKAAKEFGKLTGKCCFCGLPLSDEHSTAAGFGPTCAKNWGLTAEYKAATSVLDAEGEVPAPKSVKPTPHLDQYVAQKNMWADLVKGVKIDLATMNDKQAQDLYGSLECDLSPENVSCDGELPAAKVAKQVKFLKACIKELLSLGFNIKSVYGWAA